MADCDYELTIVAPDDGLCAQAAGATVIYANQAEADSAADRWRAKGMTATVQQIPRWEDDEPTHDAFGRPICWDERKED